MVYAQELSLPLLANLVVIQTRRRSGKWQLHIPSFNLMYLWVHVPVEERDRYLIGMTDLHIRLDYTLRVILRLQI